MTLFTLLELVPNAVLNRQLVPVMHPGDLPTPCPSPITILFQLTHLIPCGQHGDDINNERMCFERGAPNIRRPKQVIRVRNSRKGGQCSSGVIAVGVALVSNA